MRILLIKTSSMGDLIHTLPAITDATRTIPGIIFDWVVEDSFQEIPLWVPNVDRVIPVALRKWRKTPFARKTRAEWRHYRQQVREHAYDLIIDAQGLVKSAMLTRYAIGKRVGYSWRSAREALASLAYHQTYKINFQQHAILRMRILFGAALNYDFTTLPLDFNIQLGQIRHKAYPYLVFLHGTSWETKLWPETYWQSLTDDAIKAGFQIKMTGGSKEELARANQIAGGRREVEVIPRMTLTEMAHLLVGSQGAVAVDTGFGHLSAALNVPTLSLYGATDATLTGALGKNSTHLLADFACSPCMNKVCHYRKPASVEPACFTTLPPDMVWQRLKQIIL